MAREIVSGNKIVEKRCFILCISPSPPEKVLIVPLHSSTHKYVCKQCMLSIADKCLFHIFTKNIIIHFTTILIDIKLDNTISKFFIFLQY